MSASQNTSHLFTQLADKISTLLFIFGIVVFLFLGLHHQDETTPLWQSPFLISATAILGLCLSFFLKTKRKNELQKKQARVEAFKTRNTQKIVGDTILSVDANDIEPGQKLLVKVNQMIPRDGVITKGTTSIDETNLTGETVPRLKKISDKVYAGTINRDSEIVIEVSNPSRQDLLDHLLEAKKQAFAHKPLSLKKLETYTMLFNVALFVCAIIFFFVQHLALQKNILASLAMASSLFFLAPLALNFIANDHIAFFLEQTFDYRLVLKNPDTLSKITRVNSLFFNKTGTLTKGHFVFSQNFIERGTNMGDFLNVVFSLEAPCEHPLAEAMETHPWYAEITKIPVDDLQVHPGLGVCGTLKTLDNKPCFGAVGNLRFMKRHRFFISREMKAKIDELEDIGDTVVLCGFDRQVKGLMGFSDVLRKDVPDTLHRIQNMGIETSLITGDTEKTVTHLTGRLGIKKVYSRCTPEEKAAKIQKEKDNKQVVAMLGKDLDNQSAAQEADLSLAFATGIKFPKHTSEILILNRDITRLAWLFENATRTMKTIFSTRNGHLILAVSLIVLNVFGQPFALAMMILNLGWLSFGFRRQKENDAKHHHQSAETYDRSRKGNAETSPWPELSFASHPHKPVG